MDRTESGGPFARKFVQLYFDAPCMLKQAVVKIGEIAATMRQAPLSSVQIPLWPARDAKTML